MEKIIVKNFLILENIEMPINKFNLVIGEQASGKSLLSKLVYYFKNNLDDFKTYQPIIHNEVLIYLSQKTASTLLTPEGKTMVLNDILAILNKHLTNKDKYYINNVIFKTFIIQ